MSFTDIAAPENAPSLMLAWVLALAVFTTWKAWRDDTPKSYWRAVLCLGWAMLVALMLVVGVKR